MEFGTCEYFCIDSYKPVGIGIGGAFSVKRPQTDQYFLPSLKWFRFSLFMQELAPEWNGGEDKFSRPYLVQSTGYVLSVRKCRRLRSLNC